jgi:hypothetical protein
LKIEGQPTKNYRLYRINQYGEIVSVVAEADTLEEIDALRKRRQDWRYIIHHNRKALL